MAKRNRINFELCQEALPPVEGQYVRVDYSRFLVPDKVIDQPELIGKITEVTPSEITITVVAQTKDGDYIRHSEAVTYKTWNALQRTRELNIVKGRKMRNLYAMRLLRSNEKEPS